MNANTTRFLSASSVAILALAMTACGGGGGGDASTPGTIAPVAPPAPIEAVSPAGTLQAASNGTNYVAGSVQQAIFDELNASRLAAGAGLINQSASVDFAAQKHADYRGAAMRLPQSPEKVEFMRSVSAHDELDTVVPEYFYGANLLARLTKAGALSKGGSYSEVIGGAWEFSADYTPVTSGSMCIRNLLNTVYHGAILLTGFKEIGIGMSTDTANNAMCVVDLIDGGAERQVRPSGAASLIAFPASGMSVARTFYIGYEVPRPAPALIPELTAGTPVIVNFKNADFYNAEANKELVNKVTTFQMIDAAGNKVDAIILSNPSILASSSVALTPDAMLGAGTAVLVPKKPLPVGTYTVSFAADISATKTVSKTWSFSTIDIK